MYLIKVRKIDEMNICCNIHRKDIVKTKVHKFLIYILIDQSSDDDEFEHTQSLRTNKGANKSQNMR